MKRLLVILLVFIALVFTVQVYADIDVDVDNDNRMDAAFGGTDQDTSAWTGMVYFSAAGVWAETSLSAFVRGVLGDADEATLKASLNLEIGTDVQAFDADLSSYASPTAWRMFYSDAAAPTHAEIVLGADATFLESNGASAAPAFRALLYSDLTAFTEANLYTILSDVSLFLEDVVDDTTPQLGGDLDFNSKTLLDTCVAFSSTDATPDVSVGSWWKTANAGATTISDFDDSDDHSEFTQNRLILVWVEDGNTTFDFTTSSLIWSSQGSNDYAAALNDIFLFMYDSTAGKWNVISGPMPSVVSVSALTLPWGDADAALDSGGDIHLNETDEQIGIHSGDSGEIVGETAISLIQHFSITFDPAAVCDGDTNRLALFTVKDQAMEGITIDEWIISFLVDPDTELDLDLKRCTAFIGVGSAALVDVLDTLSGVAVEDTDANINGGAVVANGQKLYLEFGTSYEDTGEQVCFEMWYHLEED